MQIEAWLRDRQREDTMASVAKRLFAAGRRYEDAEKRFQALFVLEALRANGGRQIDAAKAMGVSRRTILRALSAEKISCADVKAALGGSR
jgi:DNA-binding NtrC family response regulator